MPYEKLFLNWKNLMQCNVDPKKSFLVRNVYFAIQDKPLS